jgi:chitin synthase
VAKRNGRWLLHYVKDSQAETDVPTSVAEFVSQRRRWLNGTFFCQVFALAHLGRFWSSQHGFMRKLALTFQFLYFGRATQAYGI